ncbi:MAG: hypothetical protein H0T76_10440 [Nannocystis sp.]|nr:hypothetical protein [Nannocystis sp.]MBA3546891.1 hypothetical protein [Nannocystis sp.]
MQGDHRVYRGGCWHDVAGAVRAAFRYAGSPGLRYLDLGLRLARGQE